MTSLEVKIFCLIDSYPNTGHKVPHCIMIPITPMIMIPIMTKALSSHEIQNIDG